MKCKNCNHPVWEATNGTYNDKHKWIPTSTWFHNGGVLGVTQHCQVRKCSCQKPEPKKEGKNE